MNQMIPRGYHISDNKRITRKIASAADWELYSTNHNSYVLAVSSDLYAIWVAEYSLPANLFREAPECSCMLFASSSRYLISSLDQGPYPETSGQVEAFSIAFNTANQLYADKNFSSAIYIEEYSLVLPTFTEEHFDKKIVFGRWITGGVNVSIDAIDRIISIMSWISPKVIVKSARLAGFDIDENLLSKAAEAKTHIAQESPAPEEVPSLVLSDKFSLIGRPELEQFFNENIIDIVLNREAYARMGISFPGATILHGPPGCGKTYAVEKLSEYLCWKRFDIDSSTIASPFIHDTSKKISEVFDSAIASAPSILVIDEMEAFLTDRAKSHSSGQHHIEEVAEFLRRIPEAISKGVLVFAMTNMIDSIDPAILRRGRFDHIIEVKMASAEEIEALLKTKFAELPVDESVNIPDLANQLAGHPLSDLTFVLREAGRFAVKNKLNFINNDCFIDAINLLPKKKTERPKIGFSY